MAVKKKVKGFIKLMITPGGANPSPPVGPALGQKGVAIMDFCKAFNAETQNVEDKSMKVPVKVIVYEDRSFEFTIKTPPASALIMKEIGVGKGSSTPSKNKIGRLTREQLEKIAKIKLPDLVTVDLEAAMRSIAGTARSMGVDVEEIQ